MSRSLHDAVLSNNVQEVVIRLNMGEDVNQRYPPHYDTPLHVAVTAGNEEIVRILCEHGASSNLSNFSQQTPISLAQRLGNEVILKYVEASQLGNDFLPETKFQQLENDPMISNIPPWQYSKTPETFRKCCSLSLEDKTYVGVVTVRTASCLDTNPTPFCDHTDTKDHKLSWQASLNNFKEKFLNRLSSKECYNKMKTSGKKRGEQEKKKKFVKFWLSSPNGKTSKLYSFKMES